MAPPLTMHLGATLSQSAAMILSFALMPILKVSVMCLLGLLMAISNVGILTQPARKLLTKLVFSLFLPCLIFSQLGKAVTFEKVLQWWFIPVNVLLASFIGCSVGFVVALIVRPPPRFFNFTVVMIGIGNVGNIPLVIVSAICRDDSNPFGDAESCNSNGVAYISFGQWIGAVIVNTFVYHMLAPPAEFMLEDVECANGDHSDVKKKPLHVAHPVSYDSNLTPLLASGNKAHKLVESVGASLKTVRILDILQLPVIASLFALLLGATPFLRGLFFEENGPFFFLTDSLEVVGSAMIPCIMLALGGNLVNGPGSSELGLRTTIAITATRLLMIPLAGWGIVSMVDTLGFLPPNDKMFRFVLLLQYTMPTSVLAGAVANLRGYAEKEASAILFYEHTLAIFTMAGWLVLYLNYLF